MYAWDEGTNDTSVDLRSNMIGRRAGKRMVDHLASHLSARRVGKIDHLIQQFLLGRGKKYLVEIEFFFDLVNYNSGTQRNRPLINAPPLTFS